MGTEMIFTVAEMKRIIVQADTDSLQYLFRCVEKAVLQSPEIQALRRERDNLEIGLRELIIGYVNLLESARDRIIELGGLCDSVGVMEASDPFLKSARDALAAMEQQP